MLLFPPWLTGKLSTTSGKSANRQEVAGVLAQRCTLTSVFEVYQILGLVGSMSLKPPSPLLTLLQFPLPSSAGEPLSWVPPNTMAELVMSWEKETNSVIGPRVPFRFCQ